MEIYFIAFFFTQIIAIFFFLWDKDPYSAQLLAPLRLCVTRVCHMLIAGHSNRDTKDIDDKKVERILFYWLASIPSRVYIAYVLMDWGSTTDENALPIGITFLLWLRRW